MTRSTDRHDTTDSELAVSELVELARRSLDGDLSSQEQAGLVRFEQAIARRTLGGGQRRVWTYGFGLAATAAAVAVAVTTLHPAGQKLTFDVIGSNLGDGGYVRAGNATGAEVRFSDGSNLALDPGTSTRVTELGPNGSHVFLESGHAHVRVTHRPHAHWTVDAGPYSVRVIGTEFDIRWSGTEEMFDVQLHKGSIVVSGPLASRGLSLEAGQRLVANVKQGEIFLDRGSAGTGTTSRQAPSDEEAQPAAATDEVGTAEGRGSARTLPPVRGGHARPGLSAPPASATTSDAVPWARRVAGGDFQGVLADAERRGLETTIGTASVADLAALADAARYVRRSEVARRALLAERSRFPKSREGREAAFFLGGLSEDEAGGEASKQALAWYDRYLAESPKGAYAGNALGREMVLVHKLQGAASAKPLAERYLARFPDGPYASAARTLTE
jgi:hypothetical protein